VGQDFYPVTDIHGKRFIQEIVDSANAKGIGWVDYTWLDPVSKTVRPKTVYFEKTDNVIICSGIYGANPASNILESSAEDPFLAPPEDISSAGDLEIGTYMKANAEEDVAELIPDDAKRFVERAIVFYKANDTAVALPEFSNPQGRFVQGEQYVFVLNSTGVMLAHGVTEKYVGKDFYRTMDSDGKRFIQEIVDRANAEGSGWVDYKWLEPVTRKERPKIVYFEKTNGVIVCSGIYN
jgi:cytochrome c